MTEKCKKKMKIQFRKYNHAINPEIDIKDCPNMRNNFIFRCNIKFALKWYITLNI